MARNRKGRLPMTSGTRAGRLSLPTRLRVLNVAPTTSDSVDTKEIPSRARLLELSPPQSSQTEIQHDADLDVSRESDKQAQSRTKHVAKKKKKRQSSKSVLSGGKDEMTVNSEVSAASISSLKRRVSNLAKTLRAYDPITADQLQKVASTLQAVIATPPATFQSISTSPLRTTPPPPIQILFPQQTSASAYTVVPVSAALKSAQVKTLPSARASTSREALPTVSNVQPISSTLRTPNWSVHLWPTSKVVEFVRTTPFCEPYAKAFEDNDVDGEALLLLKFANLVKSPLGMKVGHALKLMKRLQLFVAANSAFSILPDSLISDLDRE